MRIEGWAWLCHVLIGLVEVISSKWKAWLSSWFFAWKKGDSYKRNLGSTPGRWSEGRNSRVVGVKGQKWPGRRGEGRNGRIVGVRGQNGSHPCPVSDSSELFSQQIQKAYEALLVWAVLRHHMLIRNTQRNLEMQEITRISKKEEFLGTKISRGAKFEEILNSKFQRKAVGTWRHDGIS